MSQPNGPNCPRDAIPGCFLKTCTADGGASPIGERSILPAGSAKADAYSPMGIRSDSAGNLVFMDEGSRRFASITPTGAEAAGDVEGRFDRGGSPGYMGLAVDRWGNAGPKDGIYWFQTVSGGGVDGENPNDRHVNELFAWMPPGGGKSKWVTGQDSAGGADCERIAAPLRGDAVARDGRRRSARSTLLLRHGQHGITRFVCVARPIRFRRATSII